MSNVYVIIPSYNSRPWIVDLLKQIKSQDLVSKIIVVDDNSPDKTSQAIEKKFKGDKKVYLLKRGIKRGRGSAVIAGFKEALKDKRASYFIEMDSDFAHNPSDIPRLVEACKKYDTVIGSRYVKGGSTIHYGLSRKLFSKAANIWARLFLGIRITDYTSGFRCYKREVLEKIGLSSVRSTGFIVLSEVIYKIHKKKFKIGEIPILVKYHERYTSNLNLKEIANAFISIAKIKFSS